MYLEIYGRYVEAWRSVKQFCRDNNAFAPGDAEAERQTPCPFAPKREQAANPSFTLRATLQKKLSPEKMVDIYEGCKTNNPLYLWLLNIYFTSLV